MQGVHHLHTHWVRDHKSCQSFTELTHKPLLQALWPSTKEATTFGDSLWIRSQAYHRKTTVLWGWGPCWCGSTPAHHGGLCSDLEIAIHVLSESRGWHRRLRDKIVQPNRDRPQTRSQDTRLRRSIEGREHQQDSPPANGNEEDADVIFSSFNQLFCLYQNYMFSILCNINLKTILFFHYSCTAPTYFSCVAQNTHFLAAMWYTRFRSLTDTSISGHGGSNRFLTLLYLFN